MWRLHGGETMTIAELFKKYRTIGLVGNPGTGKTSLVLDELIQIKENFKIPVYALGIELSLQPYLEKKGIIILKSKEDVLDLKIRDSVLYLEEFADLFDTKTSARELDKIKRFFNRIDHLNNFVIISSAQSNFFNKFMESVIKAFIIKSVDYDMLVNGTILKRKVIAIVENTSDYRLDIPNDTYYIITSDGLVEKRTFKYNKDLDSKKENINPFLEKNVDKVKTKGLNS